LLTIYLLIIWLATDATEPAQSLFWELYEQLKSLDEQINSYDHKIKQLCRESEVCQRLLQVEGVGPLTASALIAAVGDSRQLSAFLGLVPRQSSSGGKQVLLGISKRGNTYLRSLLIHGARAVLKHAASKTTRSSLWLKDLIQRRGYNKACVALANKNARILWALLTKETSYQANS
jgi:transposase